MLRSAANPPPVDTMHCQMYLSNGSGGRINGTAMIGGTLLHGGIMNGTLVHGRRKNEEAMITATVLGILGKRVRVGSTVEKRRRACCIGLAVQAGVHNPHGLGHKSDNCRLQKAGMAFKREKQQLRRAPRKAAENNKSAAQDADYRDQLGGESNSYHKPTQEQAAVRSSSAMSAIRRRHS